MSEPDRGWASRIQRALAEGRHDSAGEICHQWRREVPDSPAARLWQARCFMACGRPAKAVDLLGEAIALTPGWADLHFERGLALFHCGRYDEAIAAYRAALELAPDAMGCRLNLGITLREARRPREAIAELSRVLARHPGLVLAHDHIASCLVDIDRHADALPHLRRVVTARPDDPRAHARLATVLKALGRLDEAENEYRSVLRLDPHDAETHWNLAMMVRHGPGHPDIAAIEAELARPGLDDAARALLDFARARAYADCGEHARAFTCLETANRLRRQTMNYDPRETDELFARIEAVFSSPLARPTATATATPRLVFIVGMPRSGTTLCEQILASHPEVYGAGETPYLAAAVETVLARPGRPFPEGLLDLDVAGMDAIRRAYIDALCSKAARDGQARAAVMVDKMPHNFRFTGLIAHLWPDARILWMRRHPLDVCLSCYEQNFLGHHPYTFDLQELGHYFLAHERLMDFWRQRLDSRLVAVDYARLVEAPRETVADLLECCGLAWSDRCLAFHELDRVVRTASEVQVRQRLYRSSINRWRHYAAQLEPLRDWLCRHGIEVPP